MSRLFDILHLKFPAPQINSQKCSLEETAGEQKTGLPAWSGWANRSFVVSETPIGGLRDALRRRRRGDNVPPSRGPGAQPRHAFGSFRRETKGTPGVGRVGPPMGGAQRGSTGGAAPSQGNWVPPPTPRREKGGVQRVVHRRCCPLAGKLGTPTHPSEREKGGAQRGSTGGAAPSQNLPGDLQETASYGILIQIYQSDKSTRNRKGRNG